ncbi:MAG: EF-P lysine aminoacylase EpmA [Deltaproteobacteria bacterium]|nr:EF-P lysine aminoacylase EpmA [Deltaproteobacteria bacterium]
MPDGLLRLGRKRARLVFRARMVQAIRAFFIEKGFLEVDTPYLQPALVPEAHIQAYGIGDVFLQTSPELCMKRLLSSGYGNIFQISHAFRRDERGDRHLPEFTLLEWYRIHADYTDLMTDCEALLRHLIHCLELREAVSCGGQQIDIGGSFERLSVADAFDRHAPVSLDAVMKAGRFDDFLVQYIEPHLGLKTPAILYDYPASLAALARLKPENRNLAERFELYVGGVELANGFSELNDAAEQRARFQDEIKKMNERGRGSSPMPERFLGALDHMPEAAGIALGVDRLAMVLTGAERIDDVVAFTPESL